MLKFAQWNMKLINMKPTYVNSARGRDVGIVMARSSDFASTNFSNLNNSRTVMQNLDNTVLKLSLAVHPDYLLWKIDQSLDGTVPGGRGYKGWLVL